MLAIRNFGHFWSRELVDWGSQGYGLKGSLRGYYLQDRKPFQVDFRDQMGIYVLFTSNRDVVYIGQAGAGDQRLFNRLRHHTRNHLRDRWTNFSWFGLREVNKNGSLSEHQTPDSRCLSTNRYALDEVEAVLIQLFEPRLNKQGPRWGDDTTEFLQYVESEWLSEERQTPDERLVLEVKKSTKQILDAIEELES